MGYRAQGGTVRKLIRTGSVSPLILGYLIFFGISIFFDIA